MGYIIFQFVMYVFAFWGIWKILDQILHASIRKKNTNANCVSCRANLEQLIILEHKNSVLEHELRDALKDPCKETLAHARALSILVIQDKLLNKLNTACQRDLQKLDGVGPKRALRVMNKRPFTSMRQVEKVFGNSVSIQKLYYWTDARWDRTSNLYHV